MAYTVGEYVQNIAMVIIFTSFINLVMPRGEFHKYIKIILGLIVIITILAPINNIAFKNKPNYTDFINKYNAKIENSTAKISNQLYLEGQQDIVFESHKERLIPHMTEIIEKNGQVTVTNLDMGFNEDTTSNKYGHIEWIDVRVSMNERPKKIIEIPKIKIGNKSTLDREKVYIDEEIEKKIKTSLIDFYDLSKTNINITVQKNL